MRFGVSRSAPPTISRRSNTRPTSRLAFLGLLSLFVLPVWGQGTPHSITLQVAAYTQGLDAATGFNFYRATVTGGPYTKLNAVPVALVATSAPIAEFVDTTGVSGTKYFYVATAVDAAGNESAASAEVNGTLPANPLAPTVVIVVK